MARRTIEGLLLFAAVSGCMAQQGQLKTKNIIFVMTDGLRWQDVFRGADAALMSKAGGVSDLDGLRQAFWREAPAARREALLPFFWTVVAKHGQIYGNRDLGSDAYVTNGMNFSYPGYSEIFCGFPDDRVDSNDKKPNPNVTMLEWLHKRPGYAGKIAAFGAWDLFPYILNSSRSGLFVNAGYDELKQPMNDKVALLNRLKRETGIWGSEALDGVTFHSALEYFRANKPKVFFLSLGDTDEWAHGGRYDLYLHAARRFDQYAKELWDTAQSMPEYRDSTTLVLAVDHGRGLAPVEWRSHGKKVPDSKYVWMAFMGPDTSPAGERSKVPEVTQSQVAATIAALLGEDYNAAVPAAGKPVPGVVKR